MKCYKKAICVFFFTTETYIFDAKKITHRKIQFMKSLKINITYSVNMTDHPKNNNL